MAISSILSTGMQGVLNGINRTDRAAGRIAAKGATGDTGALAESLVGLRIGEIETKASASVIRTGDEILGTLLDIRA